MEHSSEAALLLSCARTQIDEETATRIRRLVESSLDWSALLGLAREQMVLPLLYRSLSEVVPNAAPSSVQERLRDGFRSNVKNNLLLAHELLDLLDRFDQNNIPVVPFKGPVAAASVYGDLRLRPFVDLDVLVHPEDVTDARSLLLSQGFEEQKPLPDHFDQPASWYLALTEPASKEQAYVRDSGQKIPVPLELHWDLTPRHFQHPLDPTHLWQRLRTITFLDRQVHAFSPEDTLLYFCIHGTLDQWWPLRLICDVSELLYGHPELDWKWLMGEAKRLRSERLFLLGLRLAHELLEAPLPASVRERAYSHGAVDSLYEKVTQWLLRPASEVAGYSITQIYPLIAYNLQVRDRLRDGLGSCIYHIRQTLGAFIYHNSHCPFKIRGET
ncbi:MAG: nucleotidyltransferase family protein [Salinibacter sp.]|uniref:nucleotidyltransferase family protein n=1 Tax=Salinibacter sp. TaxID=2065818 RepID=UPI0035D4374E